MAQLYFAYGSNLNDEDLKKWCQRKAYSEIHWLSWQKAVLENHRLLFNYFSRQRECGVASVEPSAGEKVEGVLFEVASSDMKKLDRKEGHPNAYCRKDIVVTLENGTQVDAITYITQPNKRQSGLLPSKEYLFLIIEGARKYGLSPSYIAKLERIKTNDKV